MVIITNTNKERGPSQPQWAYVTRPGSPDTASFGDSLDGNSNLFTTKLLSDCTFQSIALCIASPLLHHLSTWSIYISPDPEPISVRTWREKGWLLKHPPQT